MPVTRCATSANFAEIWRRIGRYVVEVNVTGMRWEKRFAYPSQGDSELQMMRIIEDSGWRGRIGVIGEQGGDAAVNLKNDLIGLSWLALELQNLALAGPRPFPALN